VELLNPGGPIAQFKRNRCSISPVELILQSGVRTMVTQLLLKWNGYQFQLEQNELADMFIGIADGTKDGCRQDLCAKLFAGSG
jgi:hypothetical protein